VNLRDLIRAQSVLAVVARDVGEQHVGGGVLFVLGKAPQLFDRFFEQTGHMPALYQMAVWLH
jgi:hypothetical protein